MLRQVRKVTVWLSALLNKKSVRVMKKNILYFISVLAAAACFVSCQDDDFLTKVPETNLSPDTFFSSKAELDLWANRFYSRGLSTPENLAELTADDIVSANGMEAIQKGTRNPSSSWSSDTWAPLRDINYLLANNRCQDAAVKDMYDGVAYFFRALYYYKKVRVYGDIPWYDQVLGSSDTEALKKPRDPRGYVILKCLQDLDKAYERLPEKWASNSVYYVSKDAAMALKARIALFEGTFRKYHAGTPYVPQDEQTFEGITVSSEYFLRQAADAASKVMGKHSLYSKNTLGIARKATDASYREYFVLEDAETDETILSRRYSVDIAVRHGLQFDFNSKRISATTRMVNHYLQSDGTPIQNRAGWETLSYKDAFSKRDPRMAQTLHGPSYKALGETDHSELPFNRTFNGYRVIKFISDGTHDNATTSTTDYPLLRYAEVLLNYAEAKAELGELTDADVAATIDVIRARVGMPAMATVPTAVDPLMEEYYPNAKGAQKAAILEIRRERAVELIAEGFRQWDLLRWGEGKWLTPKSVGGFGGCYFPSLGEYDLDGDGKNDLLLYTGTKPATGVAAVNQIEVGKNYTLSEGDKGYLTYYAAEDYVWNEGRDYLWPIPVSERSITGGALTQNPGWDDGYDSSENE